MEKHLFVLSLFLNNQKKLIHNCNRQLYYLEVNQNLEKIYTHKNKLLNFITCRFLK